MSDAHLKRLLGEIDAKLAERLQAIGEEEREGTHRLKEEAKGQLRAEEERLHHAHGRLLARRHEKAVQQAERAARERLWQCQHACVDEVAEDIRRALEEAKGAEQWLDAWLPEARRRLGADAAPVLLVNSAWRKRIGDVEGVEIREAPMLGGAILRDESSGIEVDGSWERRLERLRPALWQRWYEGVGKHYQD